MYRRPSLERTRTEIAERTSYQRIWEQNLVEKRPLGQPRLRWDLGETRNTGLEEGRDREE